MILETSVKKILIEQRLVLSDFCVVLGVSGGPDSMALLHIMATLKSDLQLRLVVVYVDHGLRPEETPAERDLVLQAARELDIICECIVVDTPGRVKTQKLSIEHSARDLRYQAFADVAQKYGADRIAVAHTADDQVEELLIRLLRGSSRKALSGMRLQRGNIIRPLLSVTKSDLLAYLEEKKVAFCIDSSNADPSFLRNRIRGHLLPLLEEEYDPGIRSALLKTADNLSQDEDLLEQLVKNKYDRLVTERLVDDSGTCALDVNRPELLRLHPALQRRFLDHLLWQLGSAAKYEHILAILRAAASGKTGSELHLSRGLRVGVGRATLLFLYPKGRRSWRGRLYAEREK